MFHVYHVCGLSFSPNCCRRLAAAPTVHGPLAANAHSWPERASLGFPAAFMSITDLSLNDINDEGDHEEIRHRLKGNAI
jgi:hypothetical protein